MTTRWPRAFAALALAAALAGPVGANQAERRPETGPQACHPHGQDDGWRHLRGEVASARYQGSDSVTAARALRILEGVGALPGLGQPKAPVTVTVAPTRRAMDSLAGGGLAEWAGAVAIPARMEMIVPGGRFRSADPREEARRIRHEWAHLALADAMGRLRVPRWFGEGYAEWVAGGGWPARDAWRLRLALASGGAPSLDSITLGWPRDRVAAEISYLLSASALTYLVEAGGVSGLEAFFAAWRRSGSFDAALATVYGGTTSQLEEAWRKWVGRRYGWVAVIADAAVFWFLLAAVLAAACLARRRHRREQMARLRAQEPPATPKYWGVG